MTMGTIKIRDEAHALSLLEPRPQGWAARKKRIETKFPFANVPEELRHHAHAKLHELIKRWMHDHPGQTMSPVKRASLYGNAANYAKYCVTHTYAGKWGVTFRKRRAAIRFLAAAELARFKSQPLTRRVRRLI